MIDLESILTSALQNLSTSFDDGIPVATIINGHRIAMPEGPDRWLRKRHPHEPGTCAAFVALCDLFDIRAVWDIGALYGYFSILSARLLPHAKVYAFEMNPEAMAALDRTIEANGLANIQSINKGASNRSAVITADIDRFILSEDAGARRVEIVALDDFPVKPDLIKIDVEGYQAKVIPGMLRTLQQHKPLVIAEFDRPSTIGRFGVTNSQVFQPLLDMGYSAFWNKTARRMQGQFIKVNFFSMEHECNSLMVFAHPGRLSMKGASRDPDQAHEIPMGKSGDAYRLKSPSLFSAMSVSSDLSRFSMRRSTVVC
jgi:FkbM family methyltransferase